MMKKLLFVGHDFKFMTDIINYFEKKTDFEIKFDHWDGRKKHDKEKSRELLKWAEIIIAEWCLGNAVWYSKYKLPHQKLYIRLHRVEAYTKYIKKLKVNNIDKLIFIAPFMKEEVESKIDLPSDKSTLIYNTTNVNLFNNKKEDRARFNLGMLGFHTKRKRPDKVIDVFEKLKEKDNRYTLYLKGQHPEKVKWVWGKPAERKYYEELFKRIKSSPYKDSIIFEDFNDDVYKWFKKIGFILSTSDHEGSHQAVSEGMASGCIPMITGWEGAELIYPPEYVKKNCDDIADDIHFFTNNKKDYERKQKENIEYCYQHFDIDIVCRQWLELISDS